MMKFLKLGLLILFTINLYADDICYESPYSEGFFLFPRTVTPIKSISDSTLKDVTIQYAIDGFNTSDPWTSKIGIDDNPKSPQKDNPDKYVCSVAEKFLGCEDNTDYTYRADKESTFDPLGMEIFNDIPLDFWNHGISYNLGDLNPNEMHKTWTKQFIVEDLFNWFFSSTHLYANYTKNGKNYHVILNSCGNTVPEVNVADQSMQSPSADTPMHFQVTVTGTLTDGITQDNKSYIHYHTEDGTAIAGTDYIAKEGTLTINKGDTTAYIDITIKGGGNPGKFYVILDNALGARISDGNATGTITSPGGRDFILRHQQNIRGDLKSIGNTVLCKLNASGQCVEPSSNLQNADTNLQKAPTSSATLTLPQGATIKYARIYWQGREAATSSETSWSVAQQNKAKTIALKKDDGNFQQLTADVADFGSNLSTNWINIYSASADASNIVTGSGTYFIDTDSFETNTGKTKRSSPKDGLGNYGAWMLVVVYYDPNTTVTKNISLFDGYKQVTQEAGSVDVAVNGFLTPKTRDVNSTLYVFAAEGDKYIDGDHFKMAGKRHNTTLTDIAPIPNNAFDSRIDITAERNPDLTNNNGIDLQQYNVGTSGKDIITNNETGAKFQFTSTKDTYFPSVIAFSTQIYAPQLCYDYTYGQNNQFMTAPSIKPPLLDGTFDKTRPIDVKLYFKNLENSDISIQNLSVDINPIDTSIAEYSSQSVYVTRPNQSIVHIDDSDLNVSSTKNYVNNITIGDVGALDYFYTNYSLDATQTTISDMPINAVLKYNLHVNMDGKDTDLGSVETKIQDMNPCQSNASYQPVPGRFNVVHDGEVKSNDPYYYFNLPTQIVGRAGNYKIESMNPNNLNQSEDLNVTAVVALEMINMAGFHYATATCTDQNATVTSNKRVWALIDKDRHISALLGKTELKNAGLFNTAIRNAAFRLSYNTDTNDSLLKITKNNNSYTITLPSSYQGKNCTEDSTLTVASQCKNNSTITQLKDCMECIYGYQTKQMCSRDNFAIRPEAFSVTLKDQNQTNTSQTPLFITNNTNAATAPNIDLAAGYNYVAEINATDHLNNAPVVGYNTTDINANITWAPLSNALVCIDRNNTTVHNVAFSNGFSESNATVNQVGRYILKITDTAWTQVDYNSTYMTHHVTPYFRASTISDCTQNSNVTQYESSNALNGCNTSSIHTNIENSKTYTAINMSFYPYTFDLTSITPSTALNHAAITSNSFVYAADINQSTDENMSFHLNGNIISKGYNGTTLKNFTNSCYAQNLNLTLNRNVLNLPMAFRYRLHTFNANGTEIRDTNATDLNNSILPISLLKKDFANDLNGTAKTILNLNYNREINTTFNPQTITFVDYNVSSNKNIHANMKNNYHSFGLNKTNTTVKFYYGRAHAGKQRYGVPTDSPYKANIYYEIYCYGAGCHTTLLPSIKHVDDIRWYQNTLHSTSNDGNATNVFETNGIGKVTRNGAINNTLNPTTVNLSYDGSLGYPYTSTMDINASGWLIYNENNNLAKPNPFQVEFDKVGTGWGGERETNTTTKSTNVSKTNRRTMW